MLRASDRQARCSADHRFWYADLRSCRPLFASQVRGVAKTGNDLGLDRQLHRGAAERLRGERAGNAIEFEQDATRLHAGCPVFDRALALALADFGGLLRHGHIREDANPETTLALDVAGDRAAGRFDLASGDPLRFQRLQTVRAKVQIGAALGVALDPALEGLAELRFLRLQHGLVPAVFVTSRTDAGGLGLKHQAVLRERIVAENLTLEDPDL